MGLMRYHQRQQYAHLGLPEGEDSEKGTENLFKEIMTENFKKWGEKLKSRFIRFKSPQLG